MNSLDRKIESAARRAALARKNPPLSVDAFAKGDFLPNGARRSVPATPTLAGAPLPPPHAGQWKGTITGQTFADACELFGAALRADNGENLSALFSIMSHVIAAELLDTPWQRSSPQQLAYVAAQAVLMKVFEGAKNAQFPYRCDIELAEQAPTVTSGHLLMQSAREPLTCEDEMRDRIAARERTFAKLLDTTKIYTARNGRGSMPRSMDYASLQEWREAGPPSSAAAYQALMLGDAMRGPSPVGAARAEQVFVSDGGEDVRQVDTTTWFRKLDARAKDDIERATARP